MVCGVLYDLIEVCVCGLLGSVCVAFDVCVVWCCLFDVFDMCVWCGV